MNKKRYYIAYGSNLSTEQMAYRCPDARIVGISVLSGWELVFRGCATIEPNKEMNTPVLVWEISEGDERSLDVYEGYPSYYRKEELTVKVARENAKPITVTAMVYIMEDGHEERMPSVYYYNVLYRGYMAFGFPMHVLENALERAKNGRRKFGITREEDAQ